MSANRTDPGKGGSLVGFLAVTAASLFGLHGAVAGLAPASVLSASAASAGAGVFGAAAAALSAAAGSDPEPDSKPVGKDVAMLHFRSSGSSAVPGAWKADVRIPVSGEGSAHVRIRSPRRASGTFSFCGVSVPVVDGRAEIPLAALRASLSRGGISFALPSSSAVPGAPFLEI